MRVKGFRVVLYIRVPFRSPKKYGILINKKDQKRDPTLENLLTWFRGFGFRVLEFLG